MIATLPSASVAELPPTHDTAQRAVELSRQWTRRFEALADALGVNVSGWLRFAGREEWNVRLATRRANPDQQLVRATDHLTGGWMTHGPEAFQLLRHGIYEDARSALGRLAGGLAGAGVASPRLQQVLEKAGAFLQRMEDDGLPRDGGELDQLQASARMIRETIGAAASQDAGQSPGDLPLLQGAWNGAAATLSQMTRKMGLVQENERAFLADFSQFEPSL
jgi:hypothetical protein